MVSVIDGPMFSTKVRCIYLEGYNGKDDHFCHLLMFWQA